MKTDATPHLSFKEIGASRVVKGLFSYRLSFQVGMGIIFTFLPIFATEYIGLRTTQTGLLLAILVLLMSLLQLYGGKLADRLNRRSMVTAGAIIWFIFIAFIPMAHSFWQLVGLFVFGGVGGAISMPASSALSIEEGRKFGMASTIALLFVAMSIGMIIGPILGGVIMDHVSINWVFYFASIMVFTGTVSFVRFTR